jgi:hypothetical protein
MAYSDPLSRTSVLRAIDEFDRTGRNAFLRKYGFHRSRKYLIEHRGRLYDSKAIYGVAHRFEYAGAGPLSSKKFKGGKDHICPKLEHLGFSIIELDDTIDRGTPTD